MLLLVYLYRCEVDRSGTKEATPWANQGVSEEGNLLRWVLTTTSRGYKIPYSTRAVVIMALSIRIFVAKTFMNSADETVLLMSTYACDLNATHYIPIHTSLCFAVSECKTMFLDT